MSVTAVGNAKRYELAPLGARGKALWTVGNVLMLVGVYLLLYVGGLLADEQYNLLAAQGDSDIPLPEVAGLAPAELAAQQYTQNAAPNTTNPADAQVVPDTTDQSDATQPAPVPTVVRPRVRLPQLNNPGGGRELNSLVPKAVAGFGPSTIQRIQIPRILVDRKVEEVGWTLEEVDGQPVAIWEVAKYAVGHHTGSANPGQIGNIVLAGHSGGRAYPFNDIYYLKAGDKITLWSGNQQFEYTVKDRLVLDEIGPNVTMEQRRENAKYIEPTGDEMVTLVTCWPLTGPDKFNQRVVVRAVPNRPAQPAAPARSTQSLDLSGGWSPR